MAKKTISMSLSESSIKQAIKDIETYKNRLKTITDELSRRLALEGVRFAKIRIMELEAVFTQELYNSLIAGKVYGSDTSSTWAFIADCEHAAFVEFGTGYKGAESPYPYALPVGVSWDYIVGKQILANASKGIYGWFYVRDGQVYFTEGMESRPFMTQAVMEVYMKTVQIAKEVFAEYG